MGFFFFAKKKASSHVHSVCDEASMYYWVRERKKKFMFSLFLYRFKPFESNLLIC